MIISTVIFLHGWGGNKDSFRGAMNALSNHDCVSVDFPGFGEECAPEKSFSVEDYASWLHSKLLVLGKTNNLVLVGHSFGGRVAMVYAVKFAKNVEKVVLVDSAGIKPKLKINKLIKFISFHFCKGCVKIGLYSKERLALHGSDDWKSLPQNMKGTFVKVIKQDLSSFAKEIKAKTLIVWGKEDKETPLYMAKKLNKLITKSKLVVFENAGHFSYIDKHQEFVDIVNNFIG